MSGSRIEAELALRVVPVVAHGIDRVGDDVAGERQQPRARADGCLAPAPASSGDRGRAVAEQAVHDRGAHRRVEDVGGRARLRAHARRRAAPGCAADQPAVSAERVQARVAAHAHHVHPAAARRDAQLPDEQGAQARGEEAGRGDAAQVGRCRRARRRCPSGTPSSARAPMSTASALCLPSSGPEPPGRASRRRLGRQGEIAALDGAVQEDRADPGIGDPEGVEHFLL